MGRVITFLHFSDIHFNKNSDSFYCLDKDLRNEMILDVETVLEKEQLTPYGIIICGDIAYSGRVEEYEIADNFINDLINRLKINEEHVFCVPGNHDVDQTIAKRYITVYALQKLLEEADDNKFQNYLDKVKEQALEMNVDPLYYPLENYNNFSGKYMGNVSSMEQPWTHEIELDKGYKLCLYGINSTIISNADDHANRNKNNTRAMRVGRHQIPMRRDKVIYMTICHHPINDWYEDMELVMDERAMIQLYGHKHVQTLEENDKRIKIGTGALQPDRREAGWQPRYNFLSVEYTPLGLEVILYPRIWDITSQRFVSDDKVCDEDQIYKKMVLPLDYKVSDRNKAENKILYHEVRETSDQKRKLVYKLWRLQPYDREKLMREFQVFNGVPMNNLNQNIEKILSIAEENNLTKKIIERIENGD